MMGNEFDQMAVARELFSDVDTLSVSLRDLVDLYEDFEGANAQMVSKLLKIARAAMNEISPAMTMAVVQDNTSKAARLARIKRKPRLKLNPLDAG